MRVLFDCAHTNRGGLEADQESETPFFVCERLQTRGSPQRTAPFPLGKGGGKGAQGQTNPTPPAQQPSAKRPATRRGRRLSDSSGEAASAADPQAGRGEGARPSRAGRKKQQAGAKRRGGPAAAGGRGRERRAQRTESKTEGGSLQQQSRTAAPTASPRPLRAKRR